MSLHGHEDHERCTVNCPVGPVRIHFDTDCDHLDRNVCQSCAGFSDEEVAALRRYFALLAARPVPINPTFSAPC